jgi:hypothetical protein
MGGMAKPQTFPESTRFHRIRQVGGMAIPPIPGLRLMGELKTVSLY